MRMRPICIYTYVQIQYIIIIMMIIGLTWMYKPVKQAERYV